MFTICFSAVFGVGLGLFCAGLLLGLLLVFIRTGIKYADFMVVGLCSPKEDN